MSVTVTSYLCCDGAAEAIGFYQAAFGAEEVSRMAEPDGRIGHAELRLGETTLYLSDEWPEMKVRSPRSLGGHSVSFVIHVADADACFAKAVAAGAVVERPLKDEPYGRSGWLLDPWGHHWSIMSDASA